MKKVEYLLPFNTENGICRDVASFNSLLSSNADISIQDNKINFKGSSYTYSVELSIVQNQECSVFHVTIEFSRITNKFRAMLKTIKRTVGAHLREDIQILWDGVAFEWSKELYPKIYEIENSMRKLISKFMLINLGIGWHKKSVPQEINDSIRKNSIQGHGILYESDFIQLSAFLFKPYTIKDSSKLPKVLSEALDGELTEAKKEEILDFIPKNNWDRYFSDIVDAESEQLKKKWEKLYEIRCIVAHNKSMIFEQFNEGIELIEYFTLIIKNALDNVSEIEIPEEEKETISLNTMASVYEPAKLFVNDYNNFNNALLGTISSNKNVFNDIDVTSNSVATLLNSSSLGILNLSDSLKSSLGTIASTKDLILGGESYSSLNSISANTLGIFGTASKQIVNDFAIEDPNPGITKFISGNYEKTINLIDEDD